MLLYTLIALQAIGGTPADDIFAREKAAGRIEIRTVAQSTGTEYFAFPSVCRLWNGEMLAVFYNGTAHVCPDSKISMVRSTDDGKTWSKPETIIDTPMDDRDPSIMQTKTGRILVSFFTRDSRTTGAAKESNKVMVAISDDRGKTFGKPKHIDVGWAWEATSDEILEIKGGRLLCPIYGVKAGDATWRAGVAISDDGTTWNAQPASTIAYDGVIRYEEPALAVVAMGLVVCELRTTNADGFIYQSGSADMGKTWSKPERLPLRGQASNVLWNSKWGLFHTYRERTADGQTVGVAGIFGAHNKPWDPDKQFTILRIGGDCAYPSSVALPDGGILTVYYAREHRAIEAAYFSKAAVRALK